jgi:hypothetical protein
VSNQKSKKQKQKQKNFSKIFDIFFGKHDKKAFQPLINKALRQF